MKREAREGDELKASDRGNRLHRFGEVTDLRTILLVGRRDLQGQQLPERIGGEVDLGSLAPS